jgi:hypothetical protein
LGEELNQKLGASQDDVAKRDQTIGEQKGQIEELERQNAEFQEQVLKAFTKIRNDGRLAEKARKALAVAAALLEEQLVTPAEVGSGGGARGEAEKQQTEA